MLEDVRAPDAAPKGFCMATSESAGIADRKHSVIPPALFNACFALVVINVCYFPVAYFSGMWIWEKSGLGIPTDFVNVWAAGKLVLDGHPALAYDWDIQKQVELALLGQDFPGYFAWHYPPPFLFVASLLAQFPYAAAFIGWMAASIIPYLFVMRGIIGRPFGWMFAIAFPMVFNNTLVGQNGFLTAALIGGTLYLLPVRPILAGICLGLLSYKPQYGLLFPIVLIAASQWRAFISAGVTRSQHGVRVVARLRHRKLAGVFPLDADVLAGLPHRGQGDLVEAAKHLLAGALFRRHRSARPGRSSGC